MSASTEQSSQTGRPRWAAGLALLLVSGLVALLAVTGLGAVAARPRAEDGPQQASSPATTIAALTRSLRAGDLPAARALAPDDDPAAQRWLAAVVRNASALRLADVSLRYDPERTTADRAVVRTTWRMRGFDQRPAHAAVTFRLREDDGRVALTGIGGGGHVEPLWLQGRLQVRRTDDTLVLVDGSAALADRYADRAAAAVPVVRRVLPDWRGGLVVEVPSSQRRLARALGTTTASQDQVAAVTASADGSTARRAPVHVFVNPKVYDGLLAVGAQVVLSHEATHVATDAWASRMPLWLLEGFADYVALRDVDLPLSRTASEIVAEVRARGVPHRLPTDADFGARASDLGATYEGAWLLCRLLAERGGEDALVALYREVDHGRPLPTALETTVGLTPNELARRWRAELSELAP